MYDNCCKIISFQKQLVTIKVIEEVKHTAYTSVEYVGSFFESIFKELSVKMSLKTLPAPKPRVLHYLHCAQGYNQHSLIELLFEIYNGSMPLSFQVFRCHEKSTEDELSFFLQKVDGFSSTYTILEVNRLTIPLQEVGYYHILLGVYNSVYNSILHRDIRLDKLFHL